jgi:hypothetical protein
MMPSKNRVIFRPVSVVTIHASDREIRQRHEELKSAVEISPEFAEAQGAPESFFRTSGLSVPKRMIILLSALGDEVDGAD